MWEGLPLEGEGRINARMSCPRACDLRRTPLLSRRQQEAILLLRRPLMCSCCTFPARLAVLGLVKAACVVRVGFPAGAAWRCGGGSWMSHGGGGVVVQHWRRNDCGRKHGGYDWHGDGEKVLCANPNEEACGMCRGRRWRRRSNSQTQASNGTRLLGETEQRSLATCSCRRPPAIITRPNPIRLAASPQLTCCPPRESSIRHARADDALILGTCPPTQNLA